MNLRTRILTLLVPGLLLGGCGVLSTHQSPRLLGHKEKAWTAGFGTGTYQGCMEDGALDPGGECLLTADPFAGIRLGWVAGKNDTLDLSHGFPGSEMGIKLSGVPFLGGSVLFDYRIQQAVAPVYLSWDFGLSFFPCFGILLRAEDEDPEYGEERAGSVCQDQPYGGAVMAGATVGKPWLFTGFKFWLGGNSWQGWQSLPGFTLGSAFGSRTFKLIPAASVYFPQFPFDPAPGIRIIAGLGIQKSF